VEIINRLARLIFCSPFRKPACGLGFLVTGPVTRNMELALKKTCDAAPGPRLVVAVGACGCSGGIFGVNYAARGAVDAVIPVDVFIPGCPPNPHALLHGIFLAMGKIRPEQ